MSMAITTRELMTTARLEAAAPTPREMEIQQHCPGWRGSTCYG